MVADVVMTLTEFFFIVLFFLRTDVVIVNSILRNLRQGPVVPD